MVNIWRTEAHETHITRRAVQAAEWLTGGRFLRRYSWWIVHFRSLVFFIFWKGPHDTWSLGTWKLEVPPLFGTKHIWHKWMWLDFGCFFVMECKKQGCDLETASPTSFSCLYGHFTWRKVWLVVWVTHFFHWRTNKTPMTTSKNQKTQTCFLTNMSKKKDRTHGLFCVFFRVIKMGKAAAWKVAWQINSMVVWRLLDVWRSWPTPSPRSGVG